MAGRVSSLNYQCIYLVFQKLIFVLNFINGASTKIRKSNFNANHRKDEIKPKYPNPAAIPSQTYLCDTTGATSGAVTAYPPGALLFFICPSI